MSKLWMINIQQNWYIV